MESGGSGIATTQSHHQGRASKHEHGDASHVQQHGAHAAGGRELAAWDIDHVGLDLSSASLTGSPVNSERLLSRCNAADLHISYRQVSQSTRLISGIIGSAQ